MALTTLDPKWTFNRVTNKLLTEDLTDYAAQGADLASALGYIRAEYNVGSGYVILYDNLNGSTADIEPATSVFSTADINLPLGTDGKPLPASYRLTYRATANDGVTGWNITDVSIFNYTISDPEICLEETINCAGSTLTSVDATTYDVSGASTQSVSRVHTLYAPPAGGGSDVVANNVTIIASPLYTLTWTAEVVSTVTYLQDDGLYVIVELSGSKEVDVVCDTTLANIACCINNLNNTYNDLLKSNPVKAGNMYKQNIEPTMRALLLYLTFMQNNNTTKAADAYADILKYSGCSEDCGCSGSGSVVVTPTDSSASATTTYNLDSPDASIDITQQINGSVITYHLQLSAALQAAIAAAAGNVSVTTATPTFLDVTNPSTGVWNIDYVGQQVTAFYSISKQYAVYKNPGAGSYYLMDSTQTNTQGNVWTAAGSQTQVFGAGTNASTDPAIIYLQNFLTGLASAPVITAHANAMRIANTAVAAATKSIEAEVFWFDPTSLTGDVRVRLYNPATGTPYIIGDLDALVTSGQKVYVSLTLTILLT